MRTLLNMDMHTVVVGTSGVTASDVLAVARGGARIELSAEAGELLAEAGIAPVELREKEGLALLNGTDGMLGMLVMALADLDMLYKSADVTAALSLEALLGTDKVLAPELHAIRPHPGQGASAA